MVQHTMEEMTFKILQMDRHLSHCCGLRHSQIHRAKLLESSGVEYLEVPFPSEDGVPELEYLVNGFCVFDNGEEARVEASKKFIQFICDDEEWGPKNVVRTGSFPSFGNHLEIYITTKEWQS